MFPAALRLEGGTNVITVNSVAAIDNLDPWSLAVWFKVHRLQGGGAFAIKGTAAGNNRRLTFSYGNTGFMTAAADRAVADMSYTTVTGMIAEGQSYMAVATFNSANSAGDLVRFYIAPAGGQAQICPRATTTDGSGAFQSDSGVNLPFGNNSAGGSGSRELLYAAVLSNVEWTFPEIASLANDYQSRLPRGVLGRWTFGRNGGGTVFDESGNGRHGTPSGCVPVMQPFQHVGHMDVWRRFVSPEVTAGFNAAWARGSNVVLQPGIH